MSFAIFNGTPEKPLLNQYYVTAEGELIAHPYLFFTCTFQTRVNKLWAISEFGTSGMLGITNPAVALANERRHAQSTIREVIGICDSPIFLEQSEHPYHGRYLPEGRNVLNTEVLLRLDDAVDKIRLGEYPTFSRVWVPTYEAYQHWLGRFKTDKP